MFNVIICDDNKNDLQKVYNIVTKYMESNNLDYKKHIYYDYNDNFMEIVNKKIPFKIYILDIETPSRSGIDVAREIRRKDVDSAIIFLTGHNELGMDLLKEDIPFTAFINKFVNCEDRLNNCLNKTLNLMHKKRVLRIKDTNILYTINIDDILYITKDSFERKTIIITDYDEFRVNNSLNSIKEMLNDDFIQTHRACIINKNRTCRIDYSNKTITFDNNEKIDLLSSKYKREVLR